MRGVVGSLVILALCTACAEDFGSLNIVDPDGNERTFEPTGCITGAPHFFGVDLYDDNYLTLRFAQPALDDDPLIEFHDSAVAVEELAVDADACDEFDGELRRKKRSDYIMEGWAEMDCVLESGFEIRGAIEFEDCSRPEYEEDDDD